MTVTAAQIEDKLKNHFKATYISVEDLSDGCGAKLDCIIVSPQFSGKSLLNRQRAVNALIANEMKEIHAFTQKCLTPEEWEKKQTQS